MGLSVLVLTAPVPLFHSVCLRATSESRNSRITISSVLSERDGDVREFRL